MRSNLIKNISMIVLMAFIAHICYGLAPIPGSMNPILKRRFSTEYYVQGNVIRIAESDAEIRLLFNNNTSCLLLSCGKYLVARELMDNNIRLRGAMLHQNITALMQILSKGTLSIKDRYQYLAIKELILKHFPPGEDDSLPTDEYINAFVAHAFKWWLLIKGDLLFKDEIPQREMAFITTIEKSGIMKKRLNHFTAEFWDSGIQQEKIRRALNKGMVFYQTGPKRAININPTQTGRDTASLTKTFNAWDGMLAAQGSRLTILPANASKFYPEDPLDFIDSLKTYMRTGDIAPIRADIDISNWCNNDCIMCFDCAFRKSNSTIIPREKVISTFENLVKLGVKSVRFTGGGEPLTHPHFIEFVKKLHDLGFLITLETNGDGLTDEIIEVLCKYAHHVRVSVDSASQATRLRVHRPESPEFTFQRLVQNMRKLVEKRKEFGREDDLLLGTTFLIMRQNYNEVKDFALLMKDIGIDWVAIRKTFDISFYSRHSDKTREAMSQFEEAKKAADKNFRVIGPYAVSYKPQTDFSKCLIGAMRLVLLADSTGHLCCLARDKINLDKISLGPIGESRDPIDEMIERNRKTIKTFMDEAPSFCDVCIDADFNYFLESVWHLLEESPQYSFKKVKYLAYNGDRVLIGKPDPYTGITQLVLPYSLYKTVHEGKNVEINIKDAEYTNLFFDPYISAHTVQYMSKREEIRLRECSEPESTGEQIANEYASLDIQLLTDLKRHYLKPTTDVLLSGSVGRKKSNYFSDFDMYLVEDGPKDPGIGSFLNAIETITGRPVQARFHGEKVVIRELFLSFPYDRMMIRDTTVLDSSLTLAQVLGISQEELAIKDAEIALFFSLNNLITERRTGKKDIADLDLKHDVGLYKYFSFFLASLEYLSIPLEADHKGFVKEYFDFITSFRNKVQYFYGHETRIVGQEFLSHLQGQHDGEITLKRLSDMREKAVTLFQYYMPQILRKCRERIPGLEGTDLSVVLREAGNETAIDMAESAPESVLSFFAGLSSDSKILSTIAAIARKRSLWATQFFLAKNENLPYGELETLSSMKGYVNRDIRYEAAKNPQADRAIWSRLASDIHLPITVFCNKKLGDVPPEEKRNPLRVDRARDDFWKRNIDKIVRVVFDILYSNCSNSGKRQRIEEVEHEALKYINAHPVCSYNRLISHIFRLANNIMKDPFALAREKLNSLALDHYARNKKTFDAMTTPELLMACTSFNYFDRFLTHGENADKVVPKLMAGITVKGPDNLLRAAYMIDDAKNIGIVLDNYGELLFDLILISRMLTSGKQVRIFTRKTPFMISDVTKNGLYEFISTMAQTAETKEIAAVLHQGLETDNLSVTNTDAFTDGEELYVPEKFELLKSCENLDVTIFKGDWNYKAAIGMKEWQYDDPIEETDLKYFPTNAILLRTIKSPIIVGEETPLTGTDDISMEIKVMMKDAKDEMKTDYPSYDTDEFQILALDLVRDLLEQEDKSYTIKYNTSKLSLSQIAIVQEYARVLNKRFAARIRAIGTRGADKPSICVSYHDMHGRLVGEGNTDVSLPQEEKDISRYLLRITGMVNIALATSSIPEIPSEMSYQEIENEYGPIIGFIKNQWEQIIGSTNSIPKSLEDILRKSRTIILLLPPIYKMDSRKIEEYNKLAKEALISA